MDRTINNLVRKGLSEREIREELQRVAGPFIFSRNIKNPKNEKPIQNQLFFAFGGAITLGFALLSVIKSARKNH